MSYIKTPSDVFAECDQITSTTSRAEVLKANLRPAIRILLSAVFNESITFPDYSDVQYKVLKNARGIVDTSLDREAARLYIFANDCQIPLERKKAKLIQLLEGLHQEESDLLFNYILKKKLPYSKISKSFISKNFPEVMQAKISR